MRSISVYANGDRTSISYYRIWQYIDRLEGFNVICHTKYANFLLKRYYPIGLQPLHIKILAWVLMCIKTFNSLILDFFCKPQIIIVTKQFVKKRMPKIFRLLINLLLARGSKIIWDFDDDILAMKEINRSDFCYLAKKSSHILVTHGYLKNLIPSAYQDKVSLFCTTDGDMYEYYKKNCDLITETRLKLMKNHIRLVWVATKGNIPFLESVIPFLDKAAKKMNERDGKILELRIVCNGSIKETTQYLQIHNILWTRDVAIKEMENAHIGIMPLIDSAIAKGKGGFKLIQYMSIGLPCIASAVGFNRDVIDSSFGYLVQSSEDWVNAIIELSHPDSWKQKSYAAYARWKKNFSFEKNMIFFKNLCLLETE